MTPSRPPGAGPANSGRLTNVCQIFVRFQGGGSDVPGIGLALVGFSFAGKRFYIDFLGQRYSPQYAYRL